MPSPTPAEDPADPMLCQPYTPVLESELIPVLALPGFPVLFGQG